MWVKILRIGMVFFFGGVFSGIGLFAAISITDIPARASSSQEIRSQVVAAAEQYQGTPYRFGGVDRRGLDCSGLVYLSFRDALGIDIPRTTTDLYAWAEPITEHNLMPGDLVFFNTTGPLTHVGLYAGNDRFIHAASAGPKTGVMYSKLSENYWKRTFAGARRVLPPEDTQAWSKPAGPVNPANPIGPASPKPLPETDKTTEDKPSGFSLGIGLAPSWNSLLENNSAFRGMALQAGIFYDVPILSLPLKIGLELRPQWDTALHVFRMPITISAGLQDIVRIFAGPAFTLGTPVLNTGSGDRYYTGGNRWLGEAGIAIAPFSLELPRGALSLYGEIAWQSYVKEPAQEDNRKADIGATLRVSTGLRYVLNW